MNKVVVHNPLDGVLSGREDVRAFYQGRSVLVTGADGFLGFNCVRMLAGLGAHVSVLSRRAQPRSAPLAVRVFRGDLGDPELLRVALAGQSVVFDFAGVSSAVESNKDPERGLDEECRPHLRLLEACSRLQSPPVVVFPSTRLVYGKPRYLPVDEEHPLAPQSMYAVHKIAVENYLQVFGQTRGMPFCVFRISNPYGPYQPADARGYGVINQFIRRAARGEPIRIFGDGAQRRDYVYIDDLISVMMLGAMTEACHGEIFNLGGAEGVSIADAARAITRLAGDTPLAFEPWPEAYRTVETGDYFTNLTKLRSKLDLPAFTPFDEGVQRTLAQCRDEDEAAAVQGTMKV